MKRHLFSIFAALITSSILICPHQARAGLFDNIAGSLNQQIHHIHNQINNVGTNDGRQASVAASKNMAIIQAVRAGAQRQGYKAGRGKTLVIVGDAGGHVPSSLSKVAEQLGISVLRLPNSAFSDVTYAENGGVYRMQMANVAFPCSSYLETCEIQGKFWSYNQPVSINSDAVFLAQNVLYPAGVSTKRVLAGLSVVKQPGLHGDSKVLIFIDPDCSVCLMDFIKIQHDLPLFQHKFPHVSVDWVPTNLFRGEQSVGQAEQIIQVGFPALRTNYGSFDRRNENGGLSTRRVINYDNRITYNDTAVYFLSMKYGINGRAPTDHVTSLGTPTFVVLRKDLHQ